MKQQILEKQLEFPFMDEERKNESRLNRIDEIGVYVITYINFITASTVAISAYLNLRQLYQ